MSSIGTDEEAATATTTATTAADTTTTTSNASIPTKMKRLVVMAPGKDVASCKIEVQEVDVPKPSSNQVLIKMVAAAVNPSDYGTWIRADADKCPLAMGNEGSGIVVATGGGLPTYTVKVGSKVGVISPGLKQNQGTYSEYVVADAIGGIYPMPDTLRVELAASFFVNPYTALAILDTVKGHGKTFIHTAAASQLGQMMVKLAPSEGLEIVNVVRREEQAQILKDLGTKHVVVTSNENWKEELQTKIKELNVTVAMDAVAGKMTGDLLDLMPSKGTVYVYGGLAGKVENIDPMALIYKQKQVKGFILTTWIQHGGPLLMFPRMIAAGRKVNSGLDGGWSSSQFQDTTLENAQADMVKLMESGITGKKLRIRFDV